MTTLVVGASGATGKQLVEQLLSMGQNVKLIVRPTGKTTDTWKNNDKISIIKANISEISVDEMMNYYLEFFINISEFSFVMSTYQIIILAIIVILVLLSINRIINSLNSSLRLADKFKAE